MRVRRSQACSRPRFRPAWGKDFQNLRHHDGPVRAGGCFAGRDNFGDGFPVTLRIVFFVFLLETARMLAAVARSALVWTGVEESIVGHVNRRQIICLAGSIKDA